MQEDKFIEEAEKMGYSSEDITEMVKLAEEMHLPLEKIPLITQPKGDI